MRFAPREVRLEKRADGTMLLRSPQKLGKYPRCVTEWLVYWSDQAPDRVFLAERTVSGSWKKQAAEPSPAARLHIFASRRLNS